MLQAEPLSIVWLFLLIKLIPIFTVPSSLKLSFIPFLEVLRGREGELSLKEYGLVRRSLDMYPALIFGILALPTLRLALLPKPWSGRLSLVEITWGLFNYRNIAWLLPHVLLGH